MSTAEANATKRSLGFKTIEAPSLSKTVGEELFRVPELDDPNFSPTILIAQRGQEPRTEVIHGFSLSLAEIESQNADSLETLVETGETKKINALNLDMFTEEEIALSESEGREMRPSASVRLDYAGDGSNQIRVKAGIGLPVPLIAGSDGKNRRSQFPNWDMLAEVGSNVNEAFLRRVGMAAFKLVAATDKELAKRMVEAMKPEDEGPKPAESTTQGPSSLAGLAGTAL